MSLRQAFWLLAVAALVPGVGGCAAVMVGGGGGLDLGSYAVSGVKTGTGEHVEVGVTSRADGAGASGWITLTRLGYVTGGDADPIWISAAEARWTWPLELPASGARPLMELGAGLGVGVPGSVHSVAVPVHLGVGVDAPLGSWRVRGTVRARPFVFVSGSSSPLDIAGSLQLDVALLLPLGG